MRTQFGRNVIASAAWQSRRWRSERSRRRDRRVAPLLAMTNWVRVILDWRCWPSQAVLSAKRDFASRAFSHESVRRSRHEDALCVTTLILRSISQTWRHPARRIGLVDDPHGTQFARDVRLRAICGHDRAVNQSHDLSRRPACASITTRANRQATASKAYPMQEARA